MAYDDESSIFNFDDLTTITALLERYLAAPENITVTRVLALTRATHKLTSGQERGASLPELARGLRAEGLGSVPFDTVARVVDVVGDVAPEEDVLAHVTLRDLQRIVSR